ncbi:hypothetical protein NQ317_006229 [Molorchus minor]|uniref:Golgin-84 n=1 Tax=Molorchus minor TaxID=1323400 RepID=A0ABQ9K746_9CUCU|nr:hypothetical protein NQ317_006229 [Molorchus minor]
MTTSTEDGSLFGATSITTTKVFCVDHRTWDDVTFDVFKIMAWLQNLAGRTENLLNKIDQNAATVLSKSTSKLGDAELSTYRAHSIPEDVQNFSDKTGSNSTLQVLVRSPSFQNSSVKENVDDKHGSDDLGIIFDVTSETHKSLNDSVCDDKSSSKSDQLSISSSLHNSFGIVEETKIIQEKLAKIEFENQDLNKQLLNMQHLYSELRNENTNLQFQIERCNEQVTQAQIEKDQYIARAQRILQEKERLIALKQENVTDESQNIYATYNEELKKDLEFCREKNNELTQRNNQLLKDIQSLQMQHQIIQNGLQQSNQNLETHLANEKKFRMIAEEDCSQKNKEVHFKNQELVQLQDLLKSKTNEIIQLKEIIKQKTNTNIVEDIESRIKSLTQTLMLKQNNLETVTTERNALRLQLEKLETEYKKKVSSITEDSSKRLFTISSIHEGFPFDASVTRRVKRAYSTLDAISIRTGVFLRLYPGARVFIFCYMVLLHIWVLMILFWSAPSNR